MSHKQGLVPDDYASLLAEVKERVRAAQYAALKAVNRQLVALYWDIGRMIIERQSSAAHGDAIAEQLAADLQNEFPGIRGFSRRNVFLMRQFYLAYQTRGKVQPLVAQMQFYLTALDRQVREVGENPPIGIILCKEKNRTVVEYALHDARKPIGVATYRTVKRLPKELRGQLPSPEEIAKLLEAAQ